MRSLVGAVLNRTPVPYVSERRLSLPLVRRNDATAQMRAMGSVGTLFAIVSRTSTAVAKVDWRLYRKAASGKEEDRTEVTSHVALDMWQRPNDFYSGQGFVETFSQHVELVGEGIWVVARDSRSPMPMELWPVRPDRMTPVPSAKDFLAGWVYTGPDGEKVSLGVDEVIQIKMPNPLDPYRGMGPVQSIMVDLDADRYTAEWNRNFFVNSAEPGGVIELEEHLGDDEFDEMQARWAEQHRGVAAAHRVAILERGAKWVERKYTNRDMQFAELRRLSRELIREAFGFPKPMLGSSEDVNRANAEAAEVMFGRWLVVPRCDRIKDVLNGPYLRLFGEENARLYEFDYDEDDAVPADTDAANKERDSVVAAAVALIEAGFDPDDVAEAYGLPKMEFIGKPEPPAPPAIEPAAPPALVPAARAIARARLEPLAVEPAHHHARPALPPGPSITWDATQEQHLQRVQRDWQRALEDLIDDWVDNVEPDQREALRDQIESAVDDDDVAALAELAVATGYAADVLTEAMNALSSTAAERVVTEAADQGEDIDPVPGDATAIAGFATAVAGLLGTVLATSAGREAMRIRKPGDTGAQVAGAVDEFLAGLSGAVREELLGGALTNAQNSGRIETMRAAPEAAYYANETLDGNTCVFCREVDGRWLGNSLDEVEATYPNGGYVNCAGRERCRGTVVAVWRPETVDE